MNIKRATVLTASSFRHLLRVTEATSRFPERDTLILLLGITCGMRVTEIARLQVQHVLLPSGKRQEEISLPGSITKGCRPRSVYLLHPKAIAAFERYVSWRLLRKAGTALNGSEYRGLMPKTRLVLTQKASAFELSIKRRINADGSVVEYWAADSLQSYVTALYRAAGLTKGYSSHSGRRTFATRLIANGTPYEVVQQLLGHAHLDQLSAYVDVSMREMRDSIAAIHLAT